MGSVLIRVIIAPSRKTSTPQDSHSQVKQAHDKLSSISTISQSSILKTQKTKMKKSSTTLPRQVFNVSTFLRKFSECPTKVLRSSRLNLPTKDLPRPQAEHTSLFVVRRCVVSGLSYRSRSKTTLPRSPESSQTNTKPTQGVRNPRHESFDFASDLK